MISSMTGYGEAQDENQRHRVAVAARSVNHRYLDLNIRLPEAHRALESEVEAIARRHMRRGRVEIRVNIEAAGERAVRIAVRRDAVAELRRQLQPLAREGLIEDRLAPADLARLPGLIEVEPLEAEWRPEDGELLAAAVAAAMERLVEARRAEGERLEGVLLQRLERLEAVVDRTEARWSSLRAGALEALTERIRGLLGEAEVDEARLVQEAALLVEKADVREEIDRLRGHCAHFREVMSTARSVGKRLDFLSQEILRELNTIGSKSRDGEVLREVVEGKLLTEQLREQIQNVE